MKYTTYILLSVYYKKTYVGHTDNIKKRLKEHNNGKSIFSRRYKPWTLFYSEVFDTEKEAILKEKYLKSASGRRWIKKNFFIN